MPIDEGIPKRKWECHREVIKIKGFVGWRLTCGEFGEWFYALGGEVE